MSMNSRLHNLKPNSTMSKGKQRGFGGSGGGGGRLSSITTNSSPTSKSNYNSTSPYSNRGKPSTEKEKDCHFIYNMTSLVGCPATVQTRDGVIFEGVFVAFSNNQDIMLEAAHVVEGDNADEASITTHFDHLVIPSDKLMVMKFENAQTNYVTRDFLTDTGITNSVRGPNQAGDKQLTPWDGGEATEVTSMSLTLEEDKETNGWAPQDMFKKNAEKYGVVSSYSHELEGYTTSVNKNDADFKKHEEQAIQLAGEIEKNTSSLERSHVENGDDEEAKYSAVVRAEPTKPKVDEPIVQVSLVKVAKEVEKKITPTPSSSKEQIKVEKIEEKDKDAKPSNAEARVSSDSSLNINDNNNSNNNTAACPPAPPPVGPTVKPTTFAFNPNAVEFKPVGLPTSSSNNNNSSSSNFIQRQGPATPPRPPSTPASNPQVVPVPQAPQQSIYPGSLYHHPQPLVFANAYPQTLSPQNNSSINNISRHVHAHRKGNVMGGGPRREMQQAIQIQSSHQTIITSAMQNPGGPQYYPLQYPTPVRFHPTPLMFDVGPNPGQGQAAYMQHNGGGNQVPTHTVNTVPASTSMRHMAQLPTLYQSGENVHVPMHYVQLQPGVGAANMTSNQMGNQTTLTYVPNYFLTNQ